MDRIGNKPLSELLRVLPACLRDAVLYAGTDELEEIRVRTGRPVQLLYAQKERMLAFTADERFCALREKPVRRLQAEIPDAARRMPCGKFRPRGHAGWPDCTYGADYLLQPQDCAGA